MVLNAELTRWTQIVSPLFSYFIWKFILGESSKRQITPFYLRHVNDVRLTLFFFLFFIRDIIQLYLSLYSTAITVWQRNCLETLSL